MIFSLLNIYQVSLPQILEYINLAIHLNHLELLHLQARVDKIELRSQLTCLANKTTLLGLITLSSQLQL